jgi:hypothetical protein
MGLKSAVFDTTIRSNMFSRLQAVVNPAYLSRFTPYPVLRGAAILMISWLIADDRCGRRRDQGLAFQNEASGSIKDML